MSNVIKINGSEMYVLANDQLIVNYEILCYIKASAAFYQKLDIYCERKYYPPLTTTFHHLSGTIRIPLKKSHLLGIHDPDWVFPRRFNIYCVR